MDTPLALGLALGLTTLTAIGCAWLAVRRRRGRTFFARLVAPKLDAFEEGFGYDTGYLRFVADTTAAGFLRFGLFTVFAEHRAKLTDDAWYAAKLCAALREDCGPCTQLVVRMAEKAGVSARTLRAVLSADRQAMSDDARIAFDLATASLDRDLLRADDARDRVRSRFGDEGVVALAFTIASSRVYPTVKYAMGYGKACSRVVVGEEAVTPVRDGEAHAHA